MHYRFGDFVKKEVSVSDCGINLSHGLASVT